LKRRVSGQSRPTARALAIVEELPISRISRRALLIGIASASLIRASPTRATVRNERAFLSLADFGAFPDGSDASPGIERACEALRASGGGHLTIPPGTYRVAKPNGAAFRLDGLSGLEVDGHGAKLMFAGLSQPMLITNCSGVRLRGLALDWARPPFSQGDVQSLSTDGKVAEIKLDASTPMDGWSGVEAIGGYERASGLLSRRRVDAYGAVEGVEAISARVARLRLSRPIGLAEGDTVVLRHSVYGANGLEFRGCSDLSIEGVSVHAAPGMGFLGRRCRDVGLTDCVVEPTPDSGRLMSTCADAAHFVDCSGDVVVERCRFARMGDDGLNVHGTYWRIVETPDAKTIVVAKRADEPFSADDAPATGAVFAFASATTLESRGNDRALSADDRTAGPWPRRRTLRFSRDLPPGATIGDVVADETLSSRLTVRNCRFLGNRARGALAHKHVVIEGCEFRDQSMQAIVLSPDAWWLEGPEAADVRIVHNLIDGVDRWGENQGAILVDAIVAPEGMAPHSSPGHPNHDIEIAGNVFRGVSGPNIVMRATR
jgi:hypothetical protein